VALPVSSRRHSL